MSDVNKSTGETKHQVSVSPDSGNPDFNKTQFYKMSHAKGVSTTAVVDTYSAWADTYENDINQKVYRGPKYAANAIAEHFSLDIRSRIRILDVAAGTGYVGCELHKIGFTREIDALEPAIGMLKILEGRQVYGSIFNSCIGFGPIPAIDSNSNDCVVISGAMGEGHIPVAALDELVRVVKPGDLVVIVMREEYLFTVEEYANKLEPYMNQLAQRGLWSWNAKLFRTTALIRMALSSNSRYYATIKIFLLKNGRLSVNHSRML